MYSSDRFHKQISPLSLMNYPVHQPERSPKFTTIAECQPEETIRRSISTPELDKPPVTRSRRRGVILTEQGWQRLLQAEVVYTEFGDRRTFEALSEKTLLDPRTINRILSRETGVDRRTLKIFFDAFDLNLAPDDYTAASHRHPSSQPQSSQWHNIANPTPATDPLPSMLPDYAEELSQLKQRISADCHRLSILLGCDRGQTHLTIKLSPEAIPQLAIDTRQHYELPLV